MVTPALCDGVTEAVHLGLPVLAGVWATTVVTAIAAGAAVVKFYPASLGGPNYLRELRAPFPNVPFVPVGGVNPQLAPSTSDAGAIAVGVGSDLHWLRRRARTYREPAPGARP